MARLLTSVALAMLATLSGPAGAVEPTACQRLAGKDLAPARSIKLVERSLRDDPETITDSYSLSVCRLPRGRVRVLAYRFDSQSGNRGYTIDHVAGRSLVLTTADSAAKQGYSARTTLLNMRSGRSYVIARYCFGFDSDCQPGGSTTAAAAFATRGGRAVAVVVRDDLATVTSFSTLGVARALDHGTTANIPGATLRLVGNRATWTNAGVTHSARLRAG